MRFQRIHEWENEGEARGPIEKEAEANWETDVVRGNSSDALSIVSSEVPTKFTTRWLGPVGWAGCSWY